MKRIWFSFLLALGLAVGPSAFAGHETHGGDMAVASFFEYSSQIYACLDQIPHNEDSQQISTAFKKFYPVIKVYSKDKVFDKFGEEVDAINVRDEKGDLKIYVSRTRWFISDTPKYLRFVLVLHEYLSLMGFVEPQFNFSNPLVSQMSNCLKVEKL